MSETAPSTAALAGVAELIRSLAPAVDDADRIERIRQFEELKAAVAAAQAAETAAFAASQQAAQAVAGVPVARQGRGVAAQVGLARRVSPWQAQRYVGWCAVLTRELPHTFAALQAGRISEWRAMIVARETIWLSREDRAVVDAELAPRLETWGDRRVEAEVKKAAYRLDPHGFLDRIRGAESDRRVSVRPAPEAMARLTALLPVAQGVAAYASLCKAADSTTAAGDERGRGQIMADTLVERLTGQTTANAVPVEIELVMTDHALLGAADGEEGEEPAVLIGAGPIPASLARELALADEGPRWVRRLFTDPATGALIDLDPERRFFGDAERRFLRLRDQGSCATPWCDAPVRHADHIQPHDNGGATTVTNGQSLCQACNHAKQAPEWTATPVNGNATRGTITRTPTGHTYRAQPPDPPGVRPPGTRYRTEYRTRIVDLVLYINTDATGHAA